LTKIFIISPVFSGDAAKVIFGDNGCLAVFGARCSDGNKILLEVLHVF
jgi:hypothetical protein